MSRRRRNGRLAAVGVATALVLLTTTGVGASSAQASPVTPAIPVPTKLSPTAIQDVSKISPRLGSVNHGRQAVFVQFAGSGAADVSASATAAGRSTAQAKAAGRARKSAVKSTGTAVAATAKSRDAASTVLFQTTNSVPGVAVLVDNTAALQAMAARPDVVKISPLVTHTVSNSSVAQLTKALNAWQSVGDTGAGVKIGIIDTGIDYTHADFGGPGTVAAYQAALATDTGPFTPTAKVVGGYDFAGDDYDAATTDATYQPVPHPDPNPLDCTDHGTHVAGTAAGYGVNANGTTFTGDYSTLTGSALDAMRIGPGMAPRASLYALRVFGCEGSTNLLIPALDWALDPNGDGDFSDHLDIVNVSLGSADVPADEPENLVVDNLAKHGVLPVMSAGNSADLTDTGGAPGNAVRALTVASSVDAYQLRSGIKINAPSTVAGTAEGQTSVAYDWANKPDVTGAVVPLSAANADGCDKLTGADITAVAGKVAWLEWDDNDATRRCGSVARSANVKAAGAIGAIFTSGLNIFGALISGDPDIPVVQLPRTETDRLRPALTAGLNVTFTRSLFNAVKSITPAITDTLSTFSSRGTHGAAPGVVKPDVAAPGDTIASAGVGTGNGVLVLSGTSMASPATAGISALVKHRHPTWTPEQIKAAVMNTAGHDLYTQDNLGGFKYGPARVGAGRVDALAAVSTSVLAYSKTTPGAVSVSFGVVEAPATQGVVTKKQQVTVLNTGSSPTVVSLRYQGLISQPGVSYAVSPGAVSIGAHGQTTVTVTMTVQTAKLRKTIDPTMQKTQIGATGVDEARQYISDASGRLLVTPAGKSALRVPVYGAAKPVSLTKGIPTTLTGGQHGISLVGAGFNQGSGSTAFSSKVSVLDLGYRSPKEPTCEGTETTGCTSGPTAVSGDLQYVGASAVPNAAGSKADGAAWFGISTYGNWATIGKATVPYVLIDTNGDGDPDYEIDVVDLPDTDILGAVLFDATTGDAIDFYPVNFHDGDVDTNVFDTNTLLIPVHPAALGMTDAMSTFPITYSVAVYSGSTDDDIDETPAIAFDLANPAVQTSSPLYLDQNGTAIPYSLGQQPISSTRQIAVTTDRVTKARTVKALLLHLQGKSGHRAEVVRLRG